MECSPVRAYLSWVERSHGWRNVMEIEIDKLPPVGTFQCYPNLIKALRADGVRFKKLKKKKREPRKRKIKILPTGWKVVVFKKHLLSIIDGDGQAHAYILSRGTEQSTVLLPVVA